MNMNENDLLAEGLQRTPLYEMHVADGARMVSFGGWEMPLHYGSQIQEHLHTRRAVSIFDVSHMGQIEVRGGEALALVQEIVTQDASALTDGQSAYSVLCNEEGGLVDDLIVSRISPEHYFMVVNAATYRKDVAFMEAIARRLALPEAVLIPCAERWAMVAVQGPMWAEACRAALGQGDWERRPPFHLAFLQFAERELILSTTGYTGEPGAELLCPPESAVALWQALLDGGAMPAGLAARDTLRLEKGYSLSGQDFTTDENPFEAGLGWVVKLEKASFSGREALLRIKAEGVRKHLVGLLPQGGRIPRHGAPVLAAGEAVGQVTSGSFAPSLGRPVALGYVANPYAKTGQPVEINLGNTSVNAEVTSRVFYPAKISSV